jgi:hypothetical protein
MADRNGTHSFEITDKERLYLKSIQKWLDLYDGEEDFLCGKVSKELPEFEEEE